MNNMGKYDGILICSDVDGTLTAREGFVSDADRDAILRFQAEGGRFTLATGRAPDFADQFPFRCNAPLIALNGALVWDPQTKNVLARYPMVCPPEMLDFVCRSGGVRVSFCYEDQRISGDPARAPELILKGADLMKIVVAFRGDEPRALAFRDEAERRFGKNYSVSRSWGTGVEILTVGVGKGESLPILRRMLPQVHTVVGVGDYENDLSLLRCADCSFAPANAYAAAKQAAQTVLSVPAGEAIAALIAAL